MADRRYDEREIDEIFRVASEELRTQPHLSREHGMTLAELQAIGREAGIPAESVARAALALDVRRSAVSRTIFGLPVGVGRTVDLDRRLTDDEWERLVVRLRDVFNARGVTRAEGSLRQWTNGNLQVLLEPTETGHRLRLRTVHGAARASIGAGGGAIVTGAVFAAASALGGDLAAAIPTLVMLFAGGAGLFANGALRLPSWARRRASQMEAIASGVASSSGAAAPPTIPPPD